MTTSILLSREEKKNISFSNPNKKKIKTVQETRLNSDKNKLSFITSSLVHHENKKRKDKTLYTAKYWQTLNIKTIEKTKNGYYIIKTFNPDNKKWYSQRLPLNPSYLLNLEDNQNDQFQQWFNHFDIKNHPVMDYFICDDIPNISQEHQFDGIHELLLFPELYASKDLYDFCIRVYGKSRIRKDLLKITAESSILAISIAKIFKGLVPVDHLVEFLRSVKGKVSNEAELCFFEYSYKHIRKILPLVNNGTRRKLLLSLQTLFIEPSRMNINGKQRICRNKHIVTINEYKKEEPKYQNVHKELNSRRFTRTDPDPLTNDIKDSYNMVSELLKHKEHFNPNNFSSKGIKTFRDLHDRIVEVYSDTTFEIDYAKGVYKNRELNDFDLKIHNKKLDNNIQLTVAQNAKELFHYGNMMKNCIGSYAIQVHLPNVIIGAISINNNLIGNFEIRNYNEQWTLYQLLGKFNKSLENDIKTIIQEFFETIGIECNHYIGK